MDAQLVLTLIFKEDAKQYELSQDKADEIFELFNENIIEGAVENEMDEIIKLIRLAKSFRIERSGRQILIYLDYPA